MSDADELIAAALVAARGPDVRAAERHLDRLVVGTGASDGAAAVDAALFGRLVRGVGRLWPRGWQPVDVARIAARRTGARPTRLVVDLLAAERHDHVGVVPQWWDDQLRALGTRVWWDGDDRYLARWAAREGLDRVTALREAIDMLALIEGLPAIAVLRPPPGAPGGGSAAAGARGGSGSRMLDRVRALLAKAESTNFPQEAEALTAKAQELMTRHSIDQALLESGLDRPDRPGGVRLSTDTPYAGAKALLVQEVAAANRCESVWSDDLNFATVLGYPADLGAVELLYTSLLVQATSAMLSGRSERRTKTSSRRTRAYDESFLNAFALRIGERLRGATEEASRQAAEAEGRERLLPVLAARSAAVEKRVHELFPGVTRHRLTIRDSEGWSSGTSAADRALLDVGARAARPLRGGGRRQPEVRPR